MVYFGERGGSELSAAIGADLLQRFAVFGGAAREFLGSVLEWREIQVRRNSLRGGSNEWVARIVRGLENAFLDLAIALANVILRFLRQCLQFFHVGLHRVREVAEFERQQLRIGQAHHRGSAGLRQGATIDKIRVAEMRRSVRSRISLRCSADFAAAISRRRSRFQAESFVSGSEISRATSLLNFSSVCEPSTHRYPRPLLSEFM